MYFADERSLSGSLVDTLKEVQPTFFLGTPRIYEKFEEALKTIASKKGEFFNKFLDWFKTYGTRASFD